jgi:hypothetical protein
MRFFTKVLLLFVVFVYVSSVQSQTFTPPLPPMTPINSQQSVVYDGQGNSYTIILVNNFVTINGRRTTIQAGNGLSVTNVNGQISINGVPLQQVTYVNGATSCKHFHYQGLAVSLLVLSFFFI